MKRNQNKNNNHESINLSNKNMLGTNSFHKSNSINSIKKAETLGGEKENKYEKKIEFYNDTELNDLNYNEALKIDKRTFFQYYWSLIQKKHLIIFSFYTSNDYNSKIMKICLFLFSFVLFYTVNALFFNDSTMHKIYEDKGDTDLIAHIPQIIYSTIISSVIIIILKYFSLSEKDVLKIRKEKIIDNSKIFDILHCLTIKFLLFFQISTLFLIFFWYYLSCFCAVYKNTQYFLIKDTIVSFGLSLLYPFGLNLLPGLFRIPSLKKNDRQCLYQVSKIIQFIL